MTPLDYTPYYIPNIYDINRIIQDSGNYHISTIRNQISLLINFCREFPIIHRMIVEVDGMPKFPEFGSPVIFCGSLIRIL
jgi:hypothetical protein